MTTTGAAPDPATLSDVAPETCAAMGRLAYGPDMAGDPWVRLAEVPEGTNAVALLMDAGLLTFRTVRLPAATARVAIRQAAQAWLVWREYEGAQ